MMEVPSAESRGQSVSSPQWAASYSMSLKEGNELCFQDFSNPKPLGPAPSPVPAITDTSHLNIYNTGRDRRRFLWPLHSCHRGKDHSQAHTGDLEKQAFLSEISEQGSEIVNKVSWPLWLAFKKHNFINGFLSLCRTKHKCQQDHGKCFLEERVLFTVLCHIYND